MASFSQTVKCKYGIKSYQDTKNTYEWLLKAIYKMKKEPIEIRSHFHFKIGDISCSCESIEEFADNAYGAQAYSLSAMRISTYCDGISGIYLSVDYTNEVYVSAGSKRDLEEIVKLLDSTELGPEEINDPISVTYIEHQSNDIIIDGDNNAVAVNSSTAMNVETPTDSESKWKQTLRAIWQNLLSNGIWYILCLVAGLLLSRVILSK